MGRKSSITFHQCLSVLICALFLFPVVSFAIGVPDHVQIPDNAPDVPESQSSDEDESSDSHDSSPQAASETDSDQKEDSTETSSTDSSTVSKTATPSPNPDTTGSDSESEGETDSDQKEDSTETSPTDSLTVSKTATPSPNPDTTGSDSESEGETDSKQKEDTESRDLIPEERPDESETKSPPSERVDEHMGNETASSEDSVSRRNEPETQNEIKDNSDTDVPMARSNDAVRSAKADSKDDQAIQPSARQRRVSVDMIPHSEEDEEQTSVEVGVDIPKDTTITDVRYKSDFPGFEAFMEHESMIEKKRYHENSSLKRTIDVPAYVPAGNHTIQAEIQTRDSNGSIRTQRLNVTTEVPQKKGASGVIQRMMPSVSKDAYQELFTFADERANRTRSRPQIRSGLTDEETERLGFDPNTTTIIKMAPNSEIIRHTKDDTKGLQNASDERVRTAMAEMDDKDPLEINKTIERYTLVGSDGQKRNVSKVILKIQSKKSKKGIDIIESIPKSIAADVSELEILGSYEVLEEDPIVRWNFDYATGDEALSAGYIAQTDINPDATASLAAGENPSFDARAISFLLRGGWFLVLVGFILILFVAPALLYVAKRNRRLHAYKG